MSNFKSIVLNKTGDQFTREVKNIDKSFLIHGDVLVKVDYSDFNYKDGMILKNGGSLVKDYPHIPGIDFPIKIRGIVDRIDEFDGVTRIIDYKTGKVNPADLKVLSFEEIKDVKYSKAIQVLLYAFLYSQNNPLVKEQPLVAGIISFKNLKAGLLKINFSSKVKNPEHNINVEKLDDFMDQISLLLQEIYNPEIPFKEPKKLSFH